MRRVSLHDEINSDNRTVFAYDLKRRAGDEALSGRDLMVARMFGGVVRRPSADRDGQSRNDAQLTGRDALVQRMFGGGR